MLTLNWNKNVCKYLISNNNIAFTEFKQINTLPFKSLGLLRFLLMFYLFIFYIFLKESLMLTKAAFSW